jgi:putative transcriptional regulator
VRESLEGEPLDPASESIAGAVAELLAPTEPGSDSLQRLLARAEAIPTRYAPFYEQLMQMFQLDEAALEQELLRAGEPRKWKASGLPGVRVFELEAGPDLRAAQTLLVRFGTGMRFPQHRHRQPERTLILEGGYRDETGREYHPGDYDDRGTQGAHAFRALDDGPCIAASVHHGFDFTFWPLRMFQRLMGH